MTKTRVARMTLTQWQSLQSDFKTVIGDERYSMVNNPETGGVMLIPVVIITDAQNRLSV